MFAFDHTNFSSASGTFGAAVVKLRAKKMLRFTPGLLQVYAKLAPGLRQG